MNKIVFLFLFLSGAVTFGQTASTLEKKIHQLPQDAIAATFPAGNDVFTKMVYAKFNYGIIDCDDKETNQRTVIEFIVEKDGTLSDIKAVGNNNSLNREGIRIVNSIKDKWTPGIVKGKNVRMKFRQPLTLVCN